MQKTKGKTNKGITLIALVITIVVLIILAGISINLVLGENGLFTRARQAVEDFNQKAIEEKLQILYAEQLIDQNTSNTVTTTKDATSVLEEMVGEREITQKDIEEFNKLLETYNQKITSISSKEELAKIGTDNEHPLNGIYVQLSDIIYEETEEVEKIGTEEEPFTGVYNGNGKKIENLNVNVTSGNSGMFGVNTGTIKNVTIENCTINAQYMRVGAIAGSNSGLIENCIINNGNINSSANNDDNDSQLGGICGINNNGGMLRNCRNYASVTGENKLVGGICGTNSGNIENCTNSGPIEGKGEVGGITGYSKGIDENNISNIKNCINEGSVSDSNSTMTGHFGGIIGTILYSTVSNCVNKGKVEVEGTISSIGGIVGLVNVGGIVTKCQNLNEIKVTSGNCVGGIVGLLEKGGNISLCYNSKNVSAKSQIGGIVGRVTDNSFINNSYNEGNVTAEDNYVGGIGGSTTTQGPIENCCNTGNITLNSTTNQYIGGLFGHVLTSSVDKLKNCYYLEGTAEKACGNVEDIEGAISKSADEMPSLAKILGDEFASSIEDN